ncbi:MAG TPA: hypothetical protein VN541_14390 [Tepidisphaeraceae bacterium]|nr:hypothetical protein [Tepidisphaeraceae bacterium]
MPHRYLLIAMVLALMLGITSPLSAQVPVVRELVEQATEQIFKSAGREGLEQLTEMGGKAAVREILEQSSREGGEQLVKRVTQYGIEDGPMALRAIRPAPAKMVEALDGLSPEMRTAALQAVERNPSAMTQLVSQYGRGALEVAARHPGVGDRIVQELGSDGIRLGQKLTTDQSIVLARSAPDIAKLAPAQRASVVGKILRSPAPMLNFLETHPRILTTAAGVAAFMAVKDDLIGDRGHSVVGPDGTLITTPAHPGLIDRLFNRTTQAATFPITLLGIVVAAGVAGWFAIRLAGTWRATHKAAK